MGDYMSNEETYPCDDIKVITAMESLCLRPKMYTANGTVREIVEYLDVEWPTLVRDWPAFRAYLGDRDWDSMGTMNLLLCWQEWRTEIDKE
jgi:hypothetical protein